MKCLERKLLTSAKRDNDDVLCVNPETCVGCGITVFNGSECQQLVEAGVSHLRGVIGGALVQRSVI
jgi:hypothetical protein